MEGGPAPRPLLPAWTTFLPLQQQAVLVLALRGPDGWEKHTKFKVLLRALRATLMRAAYYGEFLTLKENRAGDTFMDLRIFAYPRPWEDAIREYVDDESDAADLHQFTHFMHAAEILAYKHPDETVRERWMLCYRYLADKLHMNIETEEQLDQRLNDWGRKGWDNPRN